MGDLFRSLWHVLHSESFHIQYTEDEEDLPGRRAGFVAFLWSLAGMMRCSSCRTHLSAHLAANPITPQTDLARYGVDLHNAVNRRQNKREVPFETARSHYLDGNALALCPALGRCSMPTMRPVHVAIVVISVVLLVAVILACAFVQRRRR
jgi:hypothetical protein